MNKYTFIIISIFQIYSMKCRNRYIILINNKIKLIYTYVTSN